MNDDLVDAVLVEAGQQWRDAQPPPPTADVRRLADAGSGARQVRWVPAAALAGLTVALVAVLVSWSAHRLGETTGVGPGSPTATPAEQGGGVRVEGTGYLIEDVDGQVRLCSLTITPSIKGARPRCAGVSVATIGVDEAMVRLYQGRVRVEGTYHAGTLALARVVGPAGDSGEPADKAPLPCVAPAGGWRPGNGFASPADEMEASNRVAELVDAEPDRFSGMWQWEAGVRTGAQPGEMDSAVSVKVVGTIGDVMQARSDVSAVYQGNLCVHQVAHSAADLRRIANRLSAVIGSAVVEVDVIRNRVRVAVVALDPPTMASLDEVGRDALIVEEPLLRWPQ